VFFLRETELLCEAPEPDAATLAARQRRWKACRQLGLPDILDSRKPLFAEVGSSVSGAAAAARRANASSPPAALGGHCGRRRAVASSTRARRLIWPTTPILVCPSTDPGWTPLFTRIRGLVVERGGQLSHGAIVARDFGIPAVACGRTRLRHIPEAARVRLDAVAGRVTLLEPRP
jgi:pyruvate,water dikinase